MTGPIVSLAPRRASDGAHISRRLVTQRIYPSLIKYPGGPKNGFFRFAISSEHTAEQLDALVGVLRASVKWLRPL